MDQSQGSPKGCILRVRRGEELTASGRPMALENVSEASSNLNASSGLQAEKKGMKLLSPGTSEIREYVFPLEVCAKQYIVVHSVLPVTLEKNGVCRTFMN